jgi:hypothetical protein
MGFGMWLGGTYSETLAYEEVPLTDGGTVTGKVTITAGDAFPDSRGGGHEHLVGQLVKEVIHMPKGRRSAHEIAENPRFGLEALGKSVNIKPTLGLQVP